MSFNRDRRVYKLIFEDEELEGLVVRASSLPLGKFLELANMGITGTMQLTPENVEMLNRVFEMFSEALIEWNVEQDGSPVPSDLEGIKSQDLDFILQIIMAWMKAIAGVAAPLEKASSNGNLSPEELPTMEALPTNLSE